MASAIVANSDDAIISKALDGTVLSWNPGAEAVFGYTAAEMLGKPITALFPADRLDEEPRLIAALREGRTISHFETKRVRKDGAVIDVSVTISPIRDAHGAIVAVSKIARDITERTRMQARLVETRRDLDQVLEHSPAMVALWNADRTLRYANTRFARAHGLTQESLRGRHIAEILGKDRYATAKPLIDRAMLGEAVSFEGETALPDGRVRHELVDYVANPQAYGEPGLFTFFTDITDRKHAERSAAESAETYRALYERTPAMVHSIDRQGRLLSVSDTWLKKLGYARDEVLGRRITDFLTPDSRKVALATNLPTFFEVGTVEELKYQMVCKNGSVMDILLSAVIERDAAGEFKKGMAVIQDVTDRNRAQKALREHEAFLDRAGRIAGVGGWSYDLDQAKLYWSDQTCRIHDLPPDHQPTVESAVDYYPSEARQTIANAFRACVEKQTPYDIELPLVTAKGRKIWVRTAGEPDVVGGRVVRVFGAIQDISLRKAAEGEIAAQNELLRVTLNSIGDAVITTNEQGAIQWLNPVATRLTGWLLSEARGRPIDQVFHIIHEETREPAPDPVKGAIECGRTVGLADMTVLISRDGTERAIQDSAAPIRDEKGRKLGAVLVFHDVSEQRRLSREVNFRASHDALTGLLNRSEFEIRLKRAFAGAREADQTHALMYIDLDQFKVVNDACGHVAGDALLREVAAIFTGAIRTRDTLARLGGDEFGVLMEHCTVLQARRVAQQLCDRMEAFRFIHGDQRFRIGASIGLVPLDARWNSAAEIMQAADASCYAAKEAGRNRVHEWFDTDASLKERHGEMQWATRIERALDEGRFRLYGQKISACRCVEPGLQFEVLLRLVETGGALVGPGAFLSAAERFNLASRLDRWVLREVLEWMPGQNLDDLAMVSVNLSGQSIGDRSFHRYAEDLVGRSSIDPRKLCFEITETAAIAHMGDAKEFITRVRALGVRIALDDFGAGLSSFGYLKTLPADILKIDGQFVRDILVDKLDHTAVCCFRDIAAVCELQTIAEHVETAQVFEELKRIGIDFAQGFLGHLPEPLDRLGITRARISS